MKALFRIILVGCVLVPAVMVSTQARGEDPEPTPKPEHAKAQPKRPKTLSDLAGGIKLQQEKDGSEGPVVIDNSNLKSMGRGGVVSEGGNLMPSSTPGVSGARGQGSEEEDPKLKKARDEVDRLEEQKKALNKASEERKKVNMYTGAGPQYRPPNVSDPLDTQTKNLDNDLQAAQERLKALERKERRKRSTRRPAAPSDPSGG